jgi:hypothetical protein
MDGRGFPLARTSSARSHPRLFKKISLPRGACPAGVARHGAHRACHRARWPRPRARGRPGWHSASAGSPVSSMRRHRELRKDEASIHPSNQVTLH